jgi:hypothetical protein
MANAAAPAVPGKPEQPSDREATASYIAAMASDLAFMARGQGLDVLSYILEMAKLEAENVMRPRR